MTSIPADVCRLIVGLADVSIDTKLHFGVAGKLAVDSDLRCKLDHVIRSKLEAVRKGDTTAWSGKVKKGYKRAALELRINRWSPTTYRLVLCKDRKRKEGWARETIDLGALGAQV